MESSHSASRVQPFPRVEVKQIGEREMIEAALAESLEEAIEWVKRAPNCHAGDYEVEIRQVFEMEEFAPILSEEQIQHKVHLRAQLPNQTAKK